MNKGRSIKRPTVIGGQSSSGRSNGEPRRVTDTTKLDPLEAMVIASTPGGIEASERAGSEELTMSDQLPAKMTGEDRIALQKAGVVFGTPGDDPLFIPATLPPGWKKQTTTHDMWTRLVDDKGRTRADLFCDALVVYTGATEACDRCAEALPIRSG